MQWFLKDIIVVNVCHSCTIKVTAITFWKSRYPRYKIGYVINFYFSLQFKQKPTIILLDCSKLQLGRGRLDDSVTAFRRRLEIFRQSSLPMLKTMDSVGRLTIVSIRIFSASIFYNLKVLQSLHQHTRVIWKVRVKIKIS